MAMGAREPEMAEGLYRAEHGICIHIKTIPLFLRGIG